MISMQWTSPPVSLCACVHAGTHVFLAEVLEWDSVSVSNPPPPRNSHTVITHDKKVTSHTHTHTHSIMVSSGVAILRRGLRQGSTGCLGHRGAR